MSFIDINVKVPSKYVLVQSFAAIDFIFFYDMMKYLNFLRFLRFKEGLLFQKHNDVLYISAALESCVSSRGSFSFVLDKQILKIFKNMTQSKEKVFIFESEEDYIITDNLQFYKIQKYIATCEVDRDIRNELLPFGRNGQQDIIFSSPAMDLISKKASYIDIAVYNNTIMFVRNERDQVVIDTKNTLWAGKSWTPDHIFRSYYFISTGADYRIVQINRDIHGRHWLNQTTGVSDVQNDRIAIKIHTYEELIEV